MILCCLLVICVFACVCCVYVYQSKHAETQKKHARTHLFKLGLGRRPLRRGRLVGVRLPHELPERLLHLCVVVEVLKCFFCVMTRGGRELSQSSSSERITDRPPLPAAMQTRTSSFVAVGCSPKVWYAKSRDAIFSIWQ
jgi:hypothetical protein